MRKFYNFQWIQQWKLLKKGKNKSYSKKLIPEQFIFVRYRTARGKKIPSNDPQPETPPADFHNLHCCLKKQQIQNKKGQKIHNLWRVKVKKDECGVLRMLVICWRMLEERHIMFQINSGENIKYFKMSLSEVFYLSF